MSIGDFERDTRPAGADGVYQATLSEAWDVWGPNGGYIAAIVLRAMAAESELPRPAAFHCQYLKAAKYAPVDILVERVRAGKRSAALRARMMQAGEEVLSASMWMAAEKLDGLEHDFVVKPDVPGPDGLRNYSQIFSNYADWFPYWRSIEARPVDDLQRLANPHWRTWLRLLTPAGELSPVLAAARALFWLDIGPWNAAGRPHPVPRPYVAPNLDLHVQFHDLTRQGEWTLVDAVAPVAREGLIGATMRAFSEDGALIATGGSTLFCIRNPLFDTEQGRAQQQGDPR